MSTVITKNINTESTYSLLTKQESMVITSPIPYNLSAGENGYTKLTFNNISNFIAPTFNSSYGVKTRRRDITFEDVSLTFPVTYRDGITLLEFFTELNNQITTSMGTTYPVYATTGTGTLHLIFPYYQYGYEDIKNYDVMTGGGLGGINNQDVYATRIGYGGTFLTICFRYTIPNTGGSKSVWYYLPLASASYPSGITTVEPLETSYDLFVPNNAGDSIYLHKVAKTGDINDLDDSTLINEWIPLSYTTIGYSSGWMGYIPNTQGRLLSDYISTNYIEFKYSESSDSGQPVTNEIYYGLCDLSNFSVGSSSASGSHGVTYNGIGITSVSRPGGGNNIILFTATNANSSGSLSARVRGPLKK